MKLNDPPDLLIEQALDKFAAEQGLTRRPRAIQPTSSPDAAVAVATPVTPPDDSAKLPDQSVVPGLNPPTPESHDTQRP